MPNIKINLNDIVNKKYGNLTVLKFVKEDKSKHPFKYYYECKCICGTIKVSSRTNLISGHTLSCGCLRYKQGNKNACWKGYGEISSSVFTGIKTHAKERNLTFNISIKDAWEQFIKQDKKCALTGIELTINAFKNKLSDKSASLDRIDNTKGYTKNNIQWVHKDINWMKGIFSEQKFIELCKLVAKHN